MAILLPNGKQSFTDVAGNPLVGGKLYTYAAGTNTPKQTWSDAGGAVPNTNPIILDARGEATVFWLGTYKVELRDALNNIIWTVDNIIAAAIDQTLRTDLASTAGASMIGYKRPEASTVQSSVFNSLLYFVNVKDWGVAGTNTVADTAKIQAALDEAPLGCTLFFPPGLYAVNTTIVVRRGLNLKFARGAVVLGKLSDPTKNIWEWRVGTSPDGAGDVRMLRVEDMEIGGIPGFQALHTIHIENQLPATSNLGMDFVGGSFSAADDQAGNAVHIYGLVTQLHKFWGSQIINGVYLDQCSDACRFIGCEIFGPKLGVNINIQVGAFRTMFFNNVIVCQNGAIQISGGSECDIIYNQIEQYPVANANLYNSLVMILGTSFKCRRNNITFNNFGGGGFVNRNIYLDGDTAETFIDNNTFCITSAPIDILIAAATVKWTRIGPNNYTRGSGRGGNIETPPGSGLYPANISVVDDLLLVLDAGTGTYGARRLAVPSYAGAVPGIGLAGGWTSAPNFFFEKNLNNRVMFRGRLNPGLVVPGTIVCTMPQGFWPDDFVILAVPTSTGAWAFVSITIAGVMTIISCPAGAAMDFNTVSYLCEHIGYDPGV